MPKKSHPKPAEKKAEENKLKIPPELEKKLNSIKTKLDNFKKQVLDKFGDYIVGITLLPPGNKPLLAAESSASETASEKPKEEKPDPDKIDILIVVDDTDSKKMSKDELHQKISEIVKKFAAEIDPHLSPQTVLLTDLWQNCYDAKYELNKLVSLGAPIYDTGMLAAIKIAEIHKTMVLKKFEKYILSYVLAGSLT